MILFLLWRWLFGVPVWITTHSGRSYKARMWVRGGHRGGHLMVGSLFRSTRLIVSPDGTFNNPVFSEWRRR